MTVTVKFPAKCFFFVKNCFFNTVYYSSGTKDLEMAVIKRNLNISRTSGKTRKKSRKKKSSTRKVETDIFFVNTRYIEII